MCYVNKIIKIIYQDVTFRYKIDNIDKIIKELKENIQTDKTTLLYVRQDDEMNKMIIDDGLKKNIFLLNALYYFLENK